MKKTLILLITLFFNSVALAEFDFRSYQPVSFSEILQNHRDDLLKASQKSDYTVSAATFKYVIPVKFIKELRKVSGTNKTVIRAWQRALRVPDGFINLYEHEFKAEFNSEIYWIPVQEDLLLPMSSELHPGDTFELYVVVIGAKDNKLVMLATEFKSDRAPQ